MEGDQYITTLLQKYKIQKELFILNLENGHEVVLPPILSQKKLPLSFRYYDPLVQIVRMMVSDQKTKLMGLQMSLTH